MTGSPTALDTERDGRDSRWDSHRRTRREELVDAALRAIRATGGSPSMDQIAEAAHTSKPVLYRYFSDQAGLYAAVAERIDSAFLNRLEAAIAGQSEPRARLHTLITTYLELLEADPEIYRFLEHQTVLDKRAVQYPSATTVDRATALFAEVLTIATSRETTPLLMAGVISLMRTTADKWISTTPQSARVSRITLADELTQLLWNGVQPG